MSRNRVEAGMLGFVLLSVLVWADAVPSAGFLYQAFMLLLAWSVLSTMLVGSLAAWIAYQRSPTRR